MENKTRSNTEIVFEALSQKFTSGEYCHRHPYELSAKLKISDRDVLEAFNSLIEAGLVEKIIIPSFNGSCFNEAATTNLQAKKTDFVGLQDPDDFEELDPWDLELHEFYRRKSDEK